MANGVKYSKVIVYLETQCWVEKHVHGLVWWRNCWHGEIVHREGGHGGHGGHVSQGRHARHGHYSVGHGG